MQGKVPSYLSNKFVPNKQKRSHLEPPDKTTKSISLDTTQKASKEPLHTEVPKYGTIYPQHIKILCILITKVLSLIQESHNKNMKKPGNHASSMV